MSQSIPTIRIKDDRTGISYAMNVYDPRMKEAGFNQLQQRMDYDYFESLPAEIRANKKKHDLDFNCPKCKQKSEVSSRKEKIMSGFLFFIYTRLVDIFKCESCNKEFFAEDLQNEKNYLKRDNYVIENFENWKQAKKEGKNPPEFYSIDKVDQILITNFQD